MRKFGDLARTSLPARCIRFTAYFILVLFFGFLAFLIIIAISEVQTDTAINNLLDNIKLRTDLIFLVFMVALFLLIFILVLLFHFIYRLGLLDKDVKHLNRFDYYIDFVIALAIFSMLFLVSVTTLNLFSVFVGIISMISLSLQLVIPRIRNEEKKNS